MGSSPARRNQIGTRHRKERKRWNFSAGTDRNVRGRSVFTWRDCVLAEAERFAQSEDTKVGLKLTRGENSERTRHTNEDFLYRLQSCEDCQIGMTSACTPAPERRAFTRTRWAFSAVPSLVDHQARFSTASASTLSPEKTLKITDREGILIFGKIVKPDSRASSFA